MKKRIAFITNAPAPYRSKQFETIMKNTDKFTLTFFYTGAKGKQRDWLVEKSDYFSEVYLEGLFRIGDQYLFYKKLHKITDEFDIFILGGYDSTATFKILFYLKKLNKKAIMVMDGISPDKLSEKNKVRYVLKKIFISRIDFFFANGVVSKKYLTTNFKIDEDKIYNQFLTVDVNTVTNRAEYARLNRSPNHKFTLVYSGRLLKRKRVSDILRAVSLSKFKNNIAIKIIGSGEEEEELKQLATSLNLDVKFEKFISDQNELFSRYGEVDCFILPSVNEPWGLVINEAEAAKLPVLVSESCGCSLDLVKNGVNGFTFTAGDVQGLSKKIDRIYTINVNENLMGEESFKIISNWTFWNSKNSFIKLTKQLVNEA